MCYVCEGRVIEVAGDVLHRELENAKSRGAASRKIIILAYAPDDKLPFLIGAVDVAISEIPEILELACDKLIQGGASRVGGKND